MNSFTTPTRLLAVLLLAAACVGLGYVVARSHAAGPVGDINGDGTVNIFDLSILLSDWNTTTTAADLNHDSTVNIFDLSILLSNWGQSATPSPSASAPLNANVTILNFAFSPTSITVKQGSKVTWTNQDTAGHTVQETDGQVGPNSSTIGKGQSYSFIFNTVGTFQYHCSIHPDMTGMVTVTQ